MRAIEITEPGGPEQLVLAEVEKPTPGPGEVLVAVHAAGVNRADVLQRRGHYRVPAGGSPLPGLEVSGRVEALGEGVSGFEPGERVAALLTGGGYAEYVAVPAGQLLRVPDSLSLTDAAALPEVLATVHSNIFSSARLQPGEWLLIHGGGSGIGTAAIQMAKAHGAQVAVTVGSQRKGDFCRELGADAVIDYKTEDFVERIREITGSAGAAGDGADVILDVIGAKYLERNLKALADGGRLDIIGLQGGIKAEVNLNLMLSRRLSIIATTLRSRSLESKAQIIAEVADRHWPLVASGELKPIVDSVMPLADAAKAHERMEASEHIGKILLSVADLD